MRAVLGRLALGLTTCHHSIQPWAPATVPSCPSARAAWESSLCPVLGGLLGGGVCVAGGFELQNQTPGSRARPGARSTGLSAILASLTPSWTPGVSSPRPSIPLSTMSTNRPPAHTGLLGPPTLLPGPRLPVGNVAGPAPGRDGRSPETPPSHPQGLSQASRPPRTGQGWLRQ